LNLTIWEKPGNPRECMQLVDDFRQGVIIPLGVGSIAITVASVVAYWIAGRFGIGFVPDLGR